MAHSLSFDIKIPEGHSVRFEQEATFENFIGQFQQNCPKLICVINGTNLRYYDKTTPLPTNIRFDYKQRRGSLTEYYFRDIDDDTLYCVFGREAASIFYGRIDEIDPLGNHEIPHKSESIIQNSHPSSLPLAPNNNHSIPDVQKRSPVNPDHHLEILKPKRPPIVQPIKQPSLPLFREQPNIKDNSGNMYRNNLTQNARVLDSNVRLNQGPMENINRPSMPNRVNPTKPSVPNQIVIIDQGIKLTFPNPNYPIEIKTYYPS